jgi:hypothetical protein
MAGSTSSSDRVKGSVWAPESVKRAGTLRVRRQANGRDEDETAEWLNPGENPKYYAFVSADKRRAIALVGSSDTPGKWNRLVEGIAAELLAYNLTLLGRPQCVAHVPSERPVPRAACRPGQTSREACGQGRSDALPEICVSEFISRWQLT